MAKEEGEDEAAEGRGGRGNNGVIGRMGGRDQKKVEEDYELFLRDIEEDDETRAAVNLYKAPGASTVQGANGVKTRRKVQYAMDVDEEPAATPAETDEEEEEPDFPEVRLEELLEDFDEMTLAESKEAEA